MLLWVLVSDPHQVPSQRTMSFCFFGAGAVAVSVAVAVAMAGGVTGGDWIGIFSQMFSEEGMLDSKRTLRVQDALFIPVEMGDARRLSD